MYIITKQLTGTLYQLAVSDLAKDTTIDTMHLFYIECTHFQVLFLDAYRLWHSVQKGLKGQKAALACSC